VSPQPDLRLWGCGGLEQSGGPPGGGTAGRDGIESSIVALGHDGPRGDLARKQDIEVELLPADGMSLPALMGIRRELENLVRVRAARA